jgi:L-fuculose-phosphate aldolase
MLEWICTLYWRARLIGTPRALGEDEQRAVLEHTLRTAYGRPRTADPSP